MILLHVLLDFINVVPESRHRVLHVVLETSHLALDLALTSLLSNLVLSHTIGDLVKLDRDALEALVDRLVDVLLDSVDLALPSVRVGQVVLRIDLHSVQEVLGALVSLLFLLLRLFLLGSLIDLASCALLLLGLLLLFLQGLSGLPLVLEEALHFAPWIEDLFLVLLDVLDEVHVVSHDVELGDASIQILVLRLTTESVAHDGDQHVQEDNLNEECRQEEQCVQHGDLSVDSLVSV